MLTAPAAWPASNSMRDLTSTYAAPCSCSALASVTEACLGIAEDFLAGRGDRQEPRRFAATADQLKADRQSGRPQRQRDRGMAGHVEWLRVLEHRGAHR